MLEAPNDNARRNPDCLTCLLNQSMTDAPPALGKPSQHGRRHEVVRSELVRFALLLSASFGKPTPGRHLRSVHKHILLAVKQQMPGLMKEREPELIVCLVSEVS